MITKVVMAAIIVTVLFPWQLSESGEIKSKEKIIANSPDSLKEFLLKAIQDLKDYVKAFPFPTKGRFEKTEEYNITVLDWKERGGLDRALVVFDPSNNLWNARRGPEDSILYKATGLFPVNLGKYDADAEEFDKIWLVIDPPQDPTTYIIPCSLVRNIRVNIFQNIQMSFRQENEDFWYSVNSFKYPREKARILPAGNLRCDIVFNLDYHPARMGEKKHWLYLKLYGIKFYSIETGEILFQVPEVSNKQQEESRGKESVRAIDEAKRVEKKSETSLKGAETLEFPLLQLEKNGSMYFNQDQVIGNNLQAMLEAAFLNVGGKKLYLKANQDLEYAYILDILDIIREAGIVEMGIVGEKRGREKILDVKLPETTANISVVPWDKDNLVAPVELPEGIQDFIVLTLKKDMSVLINREKTEFNMLQSRLKSIYGVHQNIPIFIRADAKLNFGDVIELIKITKGAGFDVIGIIPEYFTGM